MEGNSKKKIFFYGVNFSISKILFTIIDKNSFSRIKKKYKYIFYNFSILYYYPHLKKNT